MHPERERVRTVVTGLVRAFGSAPATAIVLGSGLGPVVDRLDDARSVSTVKLGLPRSTVPGHAGEVHVGALAGARVAMMSGRVHFYEGLPMDHVVRGVRALQAWGVRHLLLTCAAGGIADGLEPGSLVSITDHINFMGTSPLRGVPFGSVRFPDVSHAYDPQIRAVLRAAAAEVGVELQSGIYAAMPGPSYETPAEIRMLRTMGADMVGMSTVPEVLAAAALGLRVGAVATISNRAAGLAGAILDHRDVTEVARRSASQLAALLEGACVTLSGALDEADEAAQDEGA